MPSARALSLGLVGALRGQNAGTLGSLWRRLPPAVLSIADQGVVSGFSVLSGIAAAHLVGIEQFGRFALVIIVVGFAQGLHNALVTAPMMTLAGARRRVSGHYFASVLGGSLLLSVPEALVICVIFGGMFAARGDTIPVNLVLAAGVFAVAQSMQFTVRRMLFARGQGGQGLLMDSGRAAVFVAAAAALWFAGAPISAETLVWLLAASAVLTTVPFALPIWRAARGRGYLRAVARRHWAIGKWLFPVVFATFGQEQLVWIVSGVMLGDDAVGGLRAAQYLVGLVYPVLAANENTVPTAASRAFLNGGVPALRGYLFRVGLALSALVAVFVLVSFIPAEFWLKLVFGPAYVPYAACMRVLAVVVAIVFVRDMVIYFFRATQRTKAIFHAFVVSCVVSLAVMYPLLAHGGLMGAALVIAAGHATSMIYLLAVAGRTGAFSGARVGAAGETVGAGRSERDGVRGDDGAEPARPRAG